MILAVPDFILKFLCIVDRNLQGFFRLMSDIGTSRPHPTTRQFLITRAEQLMEKIQDGQAPDCIIPMCFRKPLPLPPGFPPTPAGYPPAGKSPPATKPKRRETPEWNPGDELTNPAPEPSWLLPHGKRHSTVFRDKNLGEFPRVRDAISGRTKGLCVKYHSEGRCQSNCFMIHQTKSSISTENISKMDALFKKAYGT